MKNYFIFMLKMTSKKKNTYILPSIIITLNLFIGLILNVISFREYHYPVFFFSLLFVNLIASVFYGCLKSLNIFSDLEKNGTDLILFSKPISRKKMILSKTLVFVLIGFAWSLINWVSWTVGFLSKITELNYFLFSLMMILSVFFAYIIFGIISSLISLKFTQKVAMILPILMTASPFLAGIMIRTIVRSSRKISDELLKTKYEYHHSKNEADVVTFFLNDEKDNYYIIPNGDFKKIDFDPYQKDYINLVSEYSKNAAKEWQISSWLFIPYQLVNSFNTKDIDILSLIKNNEKSFDNSILYYKDNDSLSFSYKLVDNADLLKLKISENNDNSFIIPSLLKSDSKINNDLINRNIIYVRNNADKIDIDFPEDEFSYSNPNNLIGKIYWENIEQLLKNNDFNDFAKSFFEKINEQVTNNRINDPKVIKSSIIREIENELNNDDSWLFNFSNKEITLFDENAVRNKKISSEIERKIYFSISLMYYLYFSKNDSILLTSLLLNDDPLKYYSPGQYEIKIDQFVYKIGGFESYSTKEVVKTYPNGEKKIVFRYELEKSDNFIFQAINEVYSIQRDKKIVNKAFYPLIWTSLSILLLSLNGFLYYRKDYK